MIPSRQPIDVAVSCPTCAESFETSLDVIEESQQLLDTYGYCAGLASFECPAPYFAALVTTRPLVPARTANANALDPDLARWENEGGAVPVMQSPPVRPSPGSAVSAQR